MQAPGTNEWGLNQMAAAAQWPRPQRGARQQREHSKHAEESGRRAGLGRLDDGARGDGLVAQHHHNAAAKGRGRRGQQVGQQVVQRCWAVVAFTGMRCFAASQAVAATASAANRPGTTHLFSRAIAWLPNPTQLCPVILRSPADADLCKPSPPADEEALVLARRLLHALPVVTNKQDRRQAGVRHSATHGKHARRLSEVGLRAGSCRSQGRRLHGQPSGQLASSRASEPSPKVSKHLPRPLLGAHLLMICTLSPMRAFLSTITLRSCGGGGRCVCKLAVD